MAGKLLSSAIIVVAMRWTDRAIGLVSTLILARLLVPEDFGLVAMASLMVGLLDVLLDLGVTTSLIHKRGFDAQDFSTAWTIRLIQSALVAGIIVLTSPLAADYFREPRVAPILWVMAATMFVAGFENIGIVEFQKSMQFGRDFKFFSLRRVAGFVATMSLALQFHNYWALPLGALVGRVAGVWLSYGMHPFRPRLTLSRLRSLWSFSQWMLVRSVGGYVESRFDKILVGRRSDATVVGAYALADDLAAMPSNELLMPVGRVLFPALVDARETPESMKQIYLLALALQATLAIPAAVGTALVAEDAVAVLLGPKWSMAVPFVSVIALVYAVGVMSHATGYLLLTLGHVRLIALWAWAQVGGFAVGALWVFPHAGALDLARLRLAVTVIGTCFFIALAIRKVEILRLADFVRAVWRPIAAAIVMALVLPIAASSLWSMPTFVRLVAQCCIGAGVYVVSLLGLWAVAGRPKGAETYAIRKVGALLKRQWRSS